MRMNNHSSRWFLIFLAALAVVIFATANAATPSQTPREKHIIVGGEYDYPPFSYLNSKGEPVGFSVELTQAIAKTMGLDIEIRLTPWSEARKALEDGKIDIIPGMFYSEERAKIYDFSPPFSIISDAIFARINSPSVKSIEDLRNKEIIVMRSEAMHDYILKHHLTDRLLLTETPADAMRLLASGKGDYALVAQMPGFYWLKELKLSNIRSVGPSLEPFKNCFVVRKGNNLLLSRFTEGLNILNQTGEYRNLYEKWLGVLEPTRITPGLIFKYAAMVLIPLLLLLAVSLLWSWMLRSKVNQKTKELRESEERFRVIFERSTVGKSLTASDGKLLRVNKAFADMLGYTIDEIQQHNFAQITHPDDVAESKECMRSLLSDEQTVYRFVKRYVHKSGNIVWADFSTTLIRDEHGAALHLVTSIVDITERKRAEDEIRESEARLRTLVQTIPDLIWLKDNDGVYLACNKMFERFFGASKEDIVGKTDYDFVERELADFFRENDRKAMAAEKPTSNEEWITFADDSHRALLDTIKTPMYDDRGQLIGVLGIGRDITDRKLAEEALRDSEERFRKEQKFGQLLLDTSPAFIVAIGLDGKTLMMNQSLLDALEYTTEEIKGADYLTTFVPEEDREILAKVFQDIVREVKTNVNENRIISRSGRTYLVEWHGRPVTQEGEDINIFIGVGIDITARKQAEDALHVSEERFRLLSEAAFEAIAIHEEGVLLTANEQYFKMFGYEPGEAIGKEMISVTIAPEAIELAKKQIAADGLGPYESIGLRKNGTRFPMEIRARKMEYKGHNVRFGAIRDITDRKRAEEELRESEERYRMIFTNSPLGVMHFDANGTIIDFNDKFTQIMGAPREKIIGFNMQERLRDPAMLKAVKDALDGRLGYYEGNYLSVTGEKATPIRAIYQRIAAKDGNFLGAVGLFEDISERKQAEQKLIETLDRLRRAVNTTIQVMVSAVETRDPYTSGHQTRSADLARAIATDMCLSQERIDGIRMAGSIHDIGKMSIPAEILVKPTKLSELEFSLIKEHAKKGFEMLKDVESPWPLAEIVYQHHERIDGSGYPRQLKGEEILLEARILAVADVVEAMASHRPYRPAIGLNAALAEIENNRGTLYDADAVDACLRLFREKGFQLEGT